MYPLKCLLVFITCSCLSFMVEAQPVMIKISKSDIPRHTKYVGEFIDAVHWHDSLGENVVIRSHTGLYQTQADVDSGTNSAALFAYRYLLKGDSAELGWKMTDFVKGCELDITANFLEDALLITDLDKDSIAEVWLIYQKACRGDVSPAEMKILMYEGDKKHAMRGVRRIQISETEILGGEYSFGAAFQKANAVFRQYAKKLWKQFLVADVEVL